MKATLLLISICIIVFFYTFLFTNPEVTFDAYGFSGPNLITRPYTVITSIFLHGDLSHLLSNILILLFFGTAVEKEYNSRKMLMIFFLGAFAGTFLSLLFYPWETVSIGASAGIFALIGVGMLVRPLDLSLYPLVIPVPLILLGILYAVYNAVGFVSGPNNISYIAHFAGLFVGFAFGFKKKGWKRCLIVLGIIALILVLIPLAWLVV